MPFQIQGDAQIIRIILAGELTIEEISNLGRELARLEAGFEKTPDRLTDLSAVEKGEFDYATLEGLAQRSRSRVYPNRFKSAIVAPQPLQFGLSRIFQTLSDNPTINLQVFRTRAEAEIWLAPKE